MRTLEIAIGLIEQGNEYILQRRDSRAHIGAAGLIGCFGGQIKTEEGESPIMAVARELAEETNLTGSESWNYLGPVSVTSDRNSKIVKIEAEVFRCELPQKQVVVAKDGQVVRIRKDEAYKRIHEYTPATKVLFEQLIRS